MAEMYGRLTGKPVVVMGQGIFLACNALFGSLEAVKGASPMLLLGDFTDMARFMHHAPYQAGTGEHGNHDLRNLLAGATKYTAAVSEPKQAVQTLQLAIKHATTGSPGPVAVIFGSRAFGATVKTRRPPRLHATGRHLAHGIVRPAAADVARVAEALLAASSPVIIAGNGVHASRAWAEPAELGPRLTPARKTAGQRRVEHLAELKPLHRYFAEPEQRSDAVPLRPERVITELARRLDARAIVTMDAGANRLYMTHYFQCKGAGTVYQPSSIGGMGYALPAAMGAKLTSPERDCVAVCGDGGFAMTMNALFTAAQYRIPVVTVVLNNSVLGWVKDGQRRRGNRFIASELGRNDYARIAQAMGCMGVRVETVKDLVGELDRVSGAKEPIVLDVVTTEDAPFWQVQSPLAKEGPGGE